MENILSYAAFKSQKDLKKSDGAKRSRLTGARGRVCARMHAWRRPGAAASTVSQGLQHARPPLRLPAAAPPAPARPLPRRHHQAV